MREQEREYWLAGGEDLTKAMAFIAERSAAFRAIDDLAKKYGADNTFTTRGHLSAVTFPGDIAPNGWKQLGEEIVEGKMRPYFFPSRKTKALKAIRADLQSVYAKGAHEFGSLMGAPVAMRDGNGSGMRLLYAVWEFVGDALLISIPLSDEQEASNWTPNGSRKLALSEYWAMKERAALAAASASDVVGGAQ